MAIKHAKQSGLPADDGSTSHVRPVDWYAAHTTEDTISIVLDGYGTGISTGIKADIEMGYAGSFAGWALVADQSGSIVIDLWKCTYAAFVPGSHPIATDTICGSEHPTITSTYKATGAATGWTSFSKGDIIRVNVDSCSTITRCTLALRVTSGT